MKTTLDIRNFTKSTPPRFPYEKAVTSILPGWEISLVFAGETRAKHLNEVLRNKNYIPNVLSYETGFSSSSRSGRSGEIVICPSVAKKQAPLYDMSYPTFVGYLFIHGCLHLKGMDHGATMEHTERLLLKRLLSQFKTTHVPKNRSRN